MKNYARKIRSILTLCIGKYVKYKQYKYKWHKTKNTHHTYLIKNLEPFKPKWVYLVIIWTSTSFIAVAGLFFFASLIAFIMLVWVFFHLFLALESFGLTSLKASASVPINLCSFTSNSSLVFLELFAQISYYVNIKNCEITNNWNN